jgi:quercetin dioxygenase-like cupin family protein
MSPSDGNSRTTRRIVTEHDAMGRSVFRSDDRCRPVAVASGDAKFTLLWTTREVPADNNTDAEGDARDAGLTIKGGSVIRVVDFHPGARSPMHRSLSIDYGLVLHGQIDLELDGGEIKHLQPGDVVVQRGTNHVWANASATEWTRMAFILIEARPVVVNGKVLDEHLS